MDILNTQAIQALKSALDVTWKQQQATSNNIANSETPGYKAKHVNFKKVLQEASSGGEASWKYQAETTTDKSTSSRPDGNNVNVDKEELELWQSYAQYSTLTRRISGKMNTLSYVINNTAK